MSRRPGQMSKPFWQNVNKTTGPIHPTHGRCWVWTGSKTENGYGQCSDNRPLVKRRAHRKAYILTHGTIKNGLWVLHRCDNKLCVNPGHLFLGTRQDNVDDMMAKGLKPPTVHTRETIAKISAAQKLRHAKRRETHGP